MTVMGDFSAHYVRVHQKVHWNGEACDCPPPTTEWVCENCGRTMRPRYTTVPCCGGGFDCEDEVEWPVCFVCAPDDDEG